MNSVIKVLQFIGVLNVGFIALNSSYQITSEYFSHTTMITVLVILVITSFVKDILSFIGVKILYKPLDYLFRFVTIVVTGVLSSFVILIPKLILLESQQFDSMHLKFTVRVIRNWSNEELTLYLDNLVESRGVSHFISEDDRARIIETVSSMHELRSSLNNLVNERLLVLNSKVVEPANVVTPIVTESSWLSEHVLLVTVASVLAVIAVAGIGYLVYKNYNSSSTIDRDDTSSTTSSSSEETLESVEKMIFSGNYLDDLDSEAQPKVVYDKTEMDKILEKMADRTENVHVELQDKIRGIESTIRDLKEVSDGLDEQLTVLRGSIESTKLNFIDELRKSEASHVTYVSQRIKWLKEKIEGVSRTTKMGNSGLTKKFDDLEKIKEHDARSMTSFVESLVEDVRREILNADEIAAVRALISNETIREMLCAEEAKRIIESIKKKG